MHRKLKKTLAIPLILIIYSLIALAVVFFVSRNGVYPSGENTMFYVYRGDFLYHAIVQDGNWYPILDMNWYNGVQTWRYWTPLTAIILAACQAIMRGDPFNGYLAFVGILYFCSAIVWLWIGYTHDRPVLGAFLGALWFFIPNNLYTLFIEGAIGRSISMIILPHLVVSVYMYMKNNQWISLLHIILNFIAILLLDIGWAVMIGAGIVLYLIFYVIFNRNHDHGNAISLVISLALCFLITGIYIIPAIIGGNPGNSNMKNHFQSLLASISPYYPDNEGVFQNRWLSIPYNPYFGCVTFFLCIFGILYGCRKTRPGFFTAILLCLLSVAALEPLFALCPGGQYIWMLRFICIELIFALVSLLFWRSLRKGILVFICLLLICESGMSFRLIAADGIATLPEQRYEDLESRMLIDVAKEITTQRLSIADPYETETAGIDAICGFGDRRLPTSFGRNVRAATNYENIVQINTATDEESYLYMFDRYLEQGNDTVIVPTKMANGQERELKKLNRCAQAVGYYLADENENYQVFHIDAPDSFGVISKYRGIAIGAAAGTIALDFPVVEEADSKNLNDYTFEQLSEYDTIYLAGFIYDDRIQAENLILRLTEEGKRVIILADGLPVEKRTGLRSFLGVTAYAVTFHNGYPELNTTDGYLYCSLFPEGHTTWQTFYMNGLDNVWGTIEEEGNVLDFYGTKHNENLIFIGLNLTYHYALTRDEAVGHLLSYALNLSPQELPDRKVVPVEIEYRNNTIAIHSEYDNVNTSLAYQDIFTSDQPILNLHNQLVVHKGNTLIQLHYPYWPLGVAVTAFGLLCMVRFLLDIRSRERMKHTIENAVKVFNLS